MPTPSAYTVGDARITRVEDCVLASFLPERLLPELGVSDRRLLQGMPETMAPDGQHLLLSIHSWVVQVGGKTIIVDTGVGADKARPHAPYFDRLKTPYLDRLRDAGVSPQDVDYVLHTHLHVDHVGWNTRLVDGRWTPTFPNARHLFSAKEYAYFTDPENLTERNRTSFQVQADSVTPIVAAGLAERIEVDGREVIPGFSFHPTPGHAVDHASIVLHSAGAWALFCPCSTQNATERWPRGAGPSISRPIARRRCSAPTSRRRRRGPSPARGTPTRGGSCRDAGGLRLQRRQPASDRRGLHDGRVRFGALMESVEQRIQFVDRSQDNARDEAVLARDLVA